MSSLILIPCALLTQGIYAGIIGAISTVTISACRTIKTIYNYQNSDISSVIRKMDIERQLVVIQSILTITHTSKSETMKNSTSNLKLTNMEKTQIFDIIEKKPDAQNDPIKLCLIFLRESIENIHTDLTKIYEKIENHKSKWFNYWRTLDIKHLVENLESDTKILNERFEYLMKISAFLNNINQSNNYLHHQNNNQSLDQTTFTCRRLTSSQIQKSTKLFQNYD